MKIHLNGRFLFSDHPTGTHRSAESFVAALAKARGAADLVLWCNPQWPRAAAFLREVPLQVGVVRARSTAALHAWEQMHFPALAADGIGLHLLGSAPALWGSSRQLVLVHDLNSLIIPAAFSWKFRQWSRLAKYRAIRKAGQVFCLTSYVRDTLAELLSMDVSRIQVIPQGPGVKGVEQIGAPRAREGRKQFLCVGSFQPHKNLVGVLRAWRQSGLAEQGYQLRVIGKPQRNFVYKSDAEASRASGVSFTGYISDTELSREYSMSLGLVFPSMHEGFGLPIVESFFSGTPVITSAISCMPEVAGDAALLVDPHSVEAISEAMQVLASDPARWQDLADRGWRRRQLYTWENAGRKLSRLIDEFISRLRS